MNNLHQQYKELILPKLRQQFGFKNINEVPTLQKVVVNVGINSGNKEKDFLELVESTLSRITGQKPIRTLAKTSISSFKIREGMVVGVKVTLRGERMWDFVEKLIKITLPRVRDFRGISKHGFDGRGNYALGFKENVAFAEVRSDEVERLHGLELAINTSAGNDAVGFELLSLLGFPFKND
jgi:large subunit ribosomal protein L5